MTVLRGAAWACALVAGGLVVGGCTPDEPEPTPTTPVETSTSTPETSEPTAAAPDMPAEASEPTAAGAEAFVRHWIDLINLAYASGDTSPVTEISGPTCKVCSTTVERIDSVYSQGGRIEGAQMSLDRVASPAPDASNLVSVSAALAQAPGEAIASDGARTAIDGSPQRSVAFVMVFENAAWQLRGIGSE